MKMLIALLLITGIGVSYTNVINGGKATSIQKRKTIEVLKNEEGIIHKCGSDAEPYYIIRANNKHLTLLPGNIPARFKKDELKIVFAGELKEMNVLEDDAGQLFWLNSIVVAKN